MTALDAEPVTEGDTCPAAARWALRLVALLALAISTLLMVVSKGAGPVGLPGCTPGATFDCSSVLASKWSVFWDLPTSALAVILYITVITALVYVGPRTPARYRRVAWGVVLSLSVMACGAAVWFVVLQLFVLDSICIYCMSAHACALALLVLVLRFAPLRGGAAAPLVRPAGALVCVVVGVVGVGVLIAGQMLHEPQFGPSWGPPGQDSDTGPGPDRLITLLGGRVGLKPHDYPILGSPDAKHIMICLFDFTCPHCHAFHANLIEVLDRYKPDVAVIPLPVPLDSACNKTVAKTEPEHEGACARAKLGLAVWKAKPEAYVEFDTWMFAAKAPRPLEEARQRAVELVGQDALDAALADPWIQKRIESNIGLHKLTSKYTGRASIPQLVVGSLIIAGRPNSVEELFRMLERDTDISPPDTEPAPKAISPAEAGR